MKADAGGGASCGGAVEVPLISPLAVVAPNASLGEGVRIGPFAVVGRDGDDPVEIGDRTELEDHVLIAPGATIGSDCVIEDHCRIGRGSVIASGTRIRSGVLRSDDTLARHAALTPVPREGTTTDRISPHALVASTVSLGDAVEIGPFAIIGWDDEPAVRIGARTVISPFALIEPGVTIGDDCVIDAYCRIASGATIGNRTQILYGAAVFEQAQIGDACIIGGNVADRTIIEDYVTHFGEIAHAYRHPGDLKAWDDVQAPSPTIRSRAVVGQYALLVGGIEIGEGSVVAALEVVKVKVPAGMLYQRGRMIELSKTRGFVRARDDGKPR